MDARSGDMLHTVARPNYRKRMTHLIVTIILIIIATLIIGAILSGPHKTGTDTVSVQSEYPVTMIGKYTVYYEGEKPDIAADLEKIINHPNTREVLWANRIALNTFDYWRWTREEGIQPVVTADLR
jgi:hypothetical protein